MSTPFSFEHLAAIRHGARRLVERSRAHEGDLNPLVDMAEGVASPPDVVLAAVRHAVSL